MLLKIYNPNFENITNIFTLVETTNTYSGGWLMQGFMIALFLIIFLSLLGKHNFVKSLLVSGWLSFIISLFAAYSGLISLYFVFVFLSLALVGIIVQVVHKPS